MEIKQYIQENEAKMLDDLFSLIRIPSISALPQHKGDMERCARRWCELLLEAGVQKAEVMPSNGNPLVYAEYIIDHLCQYFAQCVDGIGHGAAEVSRV